MGLIMNGQKQDTEFYTNQKNIENHVLFHCLPNGIQLRVMFMPFVELGVG